MKVKYFIPKWLREYSGYTYTLIQISNNRLKELKIKKAKNRIPRQMTKRRIKSIALKIKTNELKLYSQVNTIRI